MFGVLFRQYLMGQFNQKQQESKRSRFSLEPIILVALMSQACRKPQETPGTKGFQFENNPAKLFGDLLVQLYKEKTDRQTDRDKVVSIKETHVSADRCAHGHPQGPAKEDTGYFETQQEE